MSKTAKWVLFEDKNEKRVHHVRTRFCPPILGEFSECREFSPEKRPIMPVISVLGHKRGSEVLSNAQQVSNRPRRTYSLKTHAFLCLYFCLYIIYMCAYAYNRYGRAPLCFTLRDAHHICFLTIILFLFKSPRISFHWLFIHNCSLQMFHTINVYICDIYHRVLGSVLARPNPAPPIADIFSIHFRVRN